MAAKMGVIGFVRGLANDVAADGITVNAILPALNTPGTSGVPEEFKKNIWEGQAIKRFAEPADIAGPILFLTSDDARFMRPGARRRRRPVQDLLRLRPVRRRDCRLGPQLLHFERIDPMDTSMSNPLLSTKPVCAPTSSGESIIFH